MLEDHIGYARDFIKYEFDLELKKSQLKVYSRKDWDFFCKVNDFNPNSEGLYIPDSFCAYVRDDSDVLVSNVFHELFGHGLFAEYSNLFPARIEVYEGFALWMEALICKKTGNEDVWRLKKQRLPTSYLFLFEYFTRTKEELSGDKFMQTWGF